MLSTQKKTISYYDKFYRLACNPLWQEEINEFYDDLDQLVAENVANGGSKNITIEAFKKKKKNKDPWDIKFNL